MKKGVSVSKKNKSLYFLIAFGVVAIIAVGVYALGTVPNPGHAIKDIQTCDNSGQVLMMNAAGDAWVCSSIPSAGGSSIINFATSGEYGLSWGSGPASRIYDNGQLHLWTDDNMYMDIGGASILHINSAGLYAPAYYYSSDRNLKTNITNLDGTEALSDIQKLQGVSFNWKSDGQPDLGLIAQDVQKVYPSLVSDGGVNGTLAVNYAGLIAPLIESIKAQQAEINDLQSQVNELKSQTNNQ